MSNFEERDRIYAYLRHEISVEEDYAKASELDPYSRAVYRRMRELYWTLAKVARRAQELLAPVFARSRLREQFLAQVTPELEEAMRSGAPRIFIDATNSLASGKASGIQRVVRETARHAAEMGLALPVKIVADQLVSALPVPGFSAGIEPRAGDILLLLDAGWNHIDDYPPLLKAFRAKGGVIVAGLYDLFPLLYPTLYARLLVVNFETWIRRVVCQSDAVVAISRTSAESYLEYAASPSRPAREAQRIGWWRLGADVEETHGEASEAARAIAARGPFFLGVGTVEMRKAYPVALQAFEQLWAEGVDVNFVIVGRPGWNATAFESRLRSHKERGRRLFWLDDSGDADLLYLYRQCNAVLLTTFAEGFGLPLAEAAHFGAPVIASDIAIFREIGGDSVRYFDLLDAGSLALQMKEALGQEKIARKAAVLPWRDSTIELMRLLRDGAYQKTLELV